MKISQSWAQETLSLADIETGEWERWNAFNEGIVLLGGWFYKNIRPISAKLYQHWVLSLLLFHSNI